MGEKIAVTGMVLSAMPIGENDKRVTLLTKERGKIAAFARGARRQHSPMLAATSPFAFGTFSLYEGKNSYTMERASIERYFREIAGDYDAACMGYYFLEVADYFCQENNDESEMLVLLYQSMRALLSPAFDGRLVRAIFETKALAANGFAPNVSSCLSCGSGGPLTHFSVRRGGALCESCARAAGDSRAISASAMHALRHVISGRAAAVFDFAVKEPVLLEMEGVLRDWYAAYVGHSFRSLRVIGESGAG